jgi:hypothetical protein
MSDPALTRRYSKEEFAHRGDTIYERDIRPQLKNSDDRRFAAIDIESGLYELDENELSACDKLRVRVPEAQIWLVRVGSPYVHRFGGRSESPRMGWQRLAGGRGAHHRIGRVS